MYKITKYMLEEFQRVMAIRPQLYHEYCVAEHPHLFSKDEPVFLDVTNNDAANCLLLSKTAEMIYLCQQKGTPKSFDYPQQEECEAVALYKGLGKEKRLDWGIAIEMNDGFFLSSCGIYTEENKPKIEAWVVLHTIQWYLIEAGIYGSIEDEDDFIVAPFKDFEKA